MSKGVVPSFWRVEITRVFRWFVLADKSDLLYGIGVCGGSIFGDAVEVIVSRKDTIYWYMNATLGYRIPKHNDRHNPPLVGS